MFEKLLFKTLIIPRLLGSLAIALAFVAGLAFDNLLPAVVTLTFGVIIIWQIVKMGSNVGAIAVYDKVKR